MTASQMNSRTVYFLCGNFESKNFIYAIKFNEGKWYYFDEKDAFIQHHTSVSTHLEHRIDQLRNELRPLFMSLTEEQFQVYVKDGKFVFEGVELKTHTQLRGQPDPPSVKQRYKSNSNTDRLVFKIGKTNPADFLLDFEKCADVKVEKDKLFKIRDFVKREDRQEFSTLFFKGDWEAARNLFLKKYSFAFTENKKKALSLAFDGGDKSPRIFIDKIDAMSTYTRLSFKNQFDMILADLPNEISNLFIIKDKTNCSKAEILKFCDSIQEFANEFNNVNSGSTTPIAPSEEEDLVEQDMEIICELDPGSEVQSLSGLSSSSQLYRNRTKERVASLEQGEPSKKMKRRHMCDESDTSQTDSSIQSAASPYSDF